MGETLLPLGPVGLCGEGHGRKFVIQNLEPLPEFAQNVGASRGIKSKFDIFLFDFFWEQGFIEMRINLNETSDGLPLSAATAASSDLNEFLNLVLSGALSELKHGVVTELHQNFKIVNESLEVMG